MNNESITIKKKYIILIAVTVIINIAVHMAYTQYQSYRRDEEKRQVFDSVDKEFKTD